MVINGVKISEKLEDAIFQSYLGWLKIPAIEAPIELAYKIAEQNKISLERELVPRETEIDKFDLFGGNGGKRVKDIIAYLSTLNPEHHIKEKWYGYEDNHFVLLNNEYEDDEEYSWRIGKLLAEISEDYVVHLEKQKTKQERRANKIKHLEDELDRLKRLNVEEEKRIEREIKKLTLSDKEGIKVVDGKIV